MQKCNWCISCKGSLVPFIVRNNNSHGWDIFPNVVIEYHDTEVFYSFFFSNNGLSRFYVIVIFQYWENVVAIYDLHVEHI